MGPEKGKMSEHVLGFQTVLQHTDDWAPGHGRPGGHRLPHHWMPLQPGACDCLNLQICTAGQRAGGGASAV